MKTQAIIACELIFTLISFIAMRTDKYFSIKKRRRIKESTLLFLTFIGPVGTLTAMFLPFINGRHKSRKTVFWLTALLSLLIHVLDIYLLTVSL